MSYIYVNEQGSRIMVDGGYRDEGRDKKTLSR